MSEQAIQAVFKQVTVRRATAGGAHGGAALLSWSGVVGADRVVQVYVNGHLFDVVRDEGGAGGEAWLPAGAGEMRVELLAVAADRAWEDFSHQLAGETALGATAMVAMVRDESLPVDSRVTVTVDGEPMATERLWGPMDARSGFGGLFGIDAFGLSTATGVGHGLGEFGAGAFGADGKAWRWRGEGLSEGEHTVGLRVLDGAGRTVAEGERAVRVERLPRPAERVRLEGEALSWA